MKSVTATRRHVSRDQRGFFTIWILGLVLVIFGIGGLSLDLWKAFTERRELAAIADSAAIAGASKLDLNVFKNNGVAQLDEAGAVQRANAYIDQAVADSGIALSGRQVTVVNNQVQVELSENVGLTLSVLIAPGQPPYEVKVSSNAEPRVAP